jgi:hypothetical protein
MKRGFYDVYLCNAEKPMPKANVFDDAINAIGWMGIESAERLREHSRCRMISGKELKQMQNYSAPFWRQVE